MFSIVDTAPGTRRDRSLKTLTSSFACQTAAAVVSQVPPRDHLAEHSDPVLLQAPQDVVEGPRRLQQNDLRAAETSQAQRGLDSGTAPLDPPKQISLISNDRTMN
ncbi:hypothetical protein EYF80_055472 [Liparis tanakae]|uniref:Uncharacterized protein n=1 Tax=Liparis tanakae TaxID=230148 RepID=A0A4Z2F0G7_9TELE|nr:hypothetical protein EYF80_055472 [Liparis tanakae]